MKILLSNDDGILATGIEICHDLLVSAGHEVFVVAPEVQYSGAAHAITLGMPLMTRKVYKGGRLFGTAVEGYPSDSVRLGIRVLHPDVDVVVTGINLGNNAGPAIFYSGTIGAAWEGVFAGKTSFALSFDSFKEPDFEKIRTALGPFLEKLIGLPGGNFLYNVNIPCTDEILGIRFVRQFAGTFQDTYEKRSSPRNRDYYWLTHGSYSPEIPNLVEHAYEYSSSCGFGSDLEVVRQGYVAVTPLSLDFTDYRTLKSLRETVGRENPGTEADGRG